jgi:ABC-type phosphate transport system permease subunit
LQAANLAWKRWQVSSIIFGLFGYALVVSTLKFGFSLLSAALAGACLVLPNHIRTTQEALLTVPVSLREGSLALGATRWQSISKVVLPAAIPGIITGIMLSVGRIISETAVLLRHAGRQLPAAKVAPFRRTPRSRCICFFWRWTPTPLKSHGDRRGPDCVYRYHQPGHRFNLTKT